MKHYEVTLENSHWPMTYQTTSVADAYECIVNLLTKEHEQSETYRRTFLLRLAAMEEGNIRFCDYLGITVRLVEGEV